MGQNAAGFETKLKELLVYAKTKKDVLEYKEIADFFKNEPLTEEQYDAVYECLEKKGIDILDMSEKEDNILLSDENEEDFTPDDGEIDITKEDLSVPEGVGIEDPVRKKSEKSRCFPRKRKSNWADRWRKGMSRRRKQRGRSWRKRTCAL